MPGVVPDLPRVAVYAQHPASLAVLLGVDGVVAVEPLGLLSLGAGRDALRAVQTSCILMGDSLELDGGP